MTEVQVAPAEDATVELSVVIVSYNTIGALEDCLRSVERTMGGIEAEVFVVDNASRDGSAELVADRFPQVQLIRSPRNLGFAGGNNLAFARATGAQVLLLNSDTIVHRGAFRQMLDFMEANPEVGALGPRLLEPDGSLQPSVRRFPSVRALLYQYTAFRAWRPWRKHYLAYKMRDFDYLHAAPVDVPMGAALLVRGDLLRELGGLDDGYFMYFEEADLCRRIRARGSSIYYDPTPRVSHRGGESSRPEKDALFRIYIESMMRYKAGDLVDSRFRLFRGIFKVSFFLRMLFEIPVNLMYVLKYARLAPDAKRLKKKQAELRRTFRFFTRDLFWLAFKLGRGLKGRAE